MSTLILITALSVGAPADVAQPLLEDAANALEAGDFEAAASALESALDIDPDNVDALRAAARVAMRRGDPETAMVRLQHLLSLDPYDDGARLDLAHAQWLAQKPGDAEATLSALLERHPTLVPALELKRDLTEEQPPPEVSNWKPQARVGIAAVFDSNLSLDPGVLPDVSNKRAGLMSLEAAGVVTYTGGPFPITALARLDSMIALANQEQLGELTPTLVGAGLIGTFAIGSVTTAIDVRYDELFTNVFSNHRQRSLSPSLWLAYPLGSAHRLRLLGGADLRFPEENFGAGSSSGKVSLRDTMRLGSLLLAVEMNGRISSGDDQEGGPTSLAGALLRTNFKEIGGVLYAEYPLLDALAAFLLVEGQGRDFDSGLKETTWAAQAGARWSLGAMELHAGYGFTKNLSDTLHSYDRHQLTAGVRAYYE